MAKTMLFHFWILVLVVSRLQAVPLRDHGGVIYGTDFLRILDPRARSQTAGDSEAPERLSTTQKTTSTTTTLAVVGQPDKPHEENPLLSSRHLRKFESSTSSIRSASSSSFSSSLSRFHSRNTPKQKPPPHPRAFDHPVGESSTNGLKTSRKSIPITTDETNSTSTARADRLQDPVTSNDGNEKVNGSPSTSASSPSVFDDYDYYYYYMDDLDSITEPIGLQEVRENATNITETTVSSPTELSTPSVIIEENNIRSIKLSTSSSPATLATPKSEKATTTTSNPIKVTTAATTTINPIRATTRPTSRRTLHKVTPRPSAKRHSFRYQTTSKSTTTTTTEVSPEMAVEEQSHIQPDTVTSPSLNTATLETPTNTPTSDRSKNRLSHSDSIRTLESANRGASRSASRSSLSQKATTQPPLVEDAVPSPVISNSSPSTSQSPIPRIQERHQRPKGARNGTSRYFRYTTPASKTEKLKGDTAVTERITLDENTLQKSLGSASSSSIVVEVRVESPQPEARRMPSRKSPPLLQILDKDVGKGTQAPPRTVHTVNPDYHTTSFLLSDSLVVDLASGPKTSDQQPGKAPQRQRQPSNRSQSRPSTSTARTESPPHARSQPNTTTEQSNAPVALSLQQRENKQNQTSASPPSSESVKVIDDRPTSDQAQAQSSVTENTESENTKTVSVIDVKESEQTGNSSTSVSQDTDIPIQTQSQSVSTSVSRTVIHTAEEISSSILQPNITAQKPLISMTAFSGNVTSVSNNTLLSNSTLRSRSRARMHSLHGIAPQGLAPFGEAPAGLTPFGEAPEGLAPHGLQPTGLHPHGLAPQGVGLNNSSNATKTTQGGRLTFVDATVAEGGADANNSVGYVAVEHNISRFRLEEKTPDGFIIGEYGEVDHLTGDVNGVRYTAEGSADPNLIYDALIKFLNL